MLDLIWEYVRNMRDGHAKVKMDEVRRHIDDTRFAWIGGIEPKSVFYYRIQNPVILIDPLEAEDIEAIEHPTRVPEFKFISLGNGIEPGSSGTYGFALRNRYNDSIVNVTLTTEIYRWATVEAVRNATELARPPVFAPTLSLGTTAAIPSLAANASVDLRAVVLTDAATVEGVYFTRHQIEFDYPNFTLPGNATPRSAHFVMKSRGYFTAEEFQSINYSDLERSLADLGVAGIVPDSSFSVKRPAPLWPLALVVAATALSGGLATALYLTDTYPGRFPRLKGGLLRMTGKTYVWRTLAEEELRARLGRGGPPT